MTIVELNTLLQYLGKLIANWWWLPLPFLFWERLLFFYRWSRVDGFLAKQKNVLLEIKLPVEILKPVRAMEQVMASIHAAVFHPPDNWEKWIDGQVQMSISFEIASFGGDVHFYIRTPISYRDAVEASVYSQYPEIELQEVEDYTKYVPQNIPNKEWDLWGADYRMIRNDHYPIKTYIQFETEQEREEEKRVDPVATLLESMSKIIPGEQLWIQIVAEPTAAVEEIPEFEKWLNDGKRLRDKLAQRPVDEDKPKSFLLETIEAFCSIMFLGKVPEKKKEEKQLLPPEMKLTPGEKEVVAAIEKKMSKQCFKTSIRFILLGKRDVWFKPKFRLVFAFFSDFMTLNLNAVIPMGDTITKIKKSYKFLPINYFRPRRQYLRCRRMFRNYVRRFSPGFPRVVPAGVFIMNIEEMASLFHFPSRATAPGPGLARIESKRGALPPGLPVEE